MTLSAPLVMKEISHFPHCWGLWHTVMVVSVYAEWPEPPRMATPIWRGKIASASHVNCTLLCVEKGSLPKKKAIKIRLISIAMSLCENKPKKQTVCGEFRLAGRTRRSRRGNDTRQLNKGRPLETVPPSLSPNVDAGSAV
jgi:hypothetical protein